MEKAVQTGTSGVTGKVDQTSMILTLIRRGDSISQISHILNVRRNDVEKVMNWYVEQMMA